MIPTRKEIKYALKRVLVVLTLGIGVLFLARVRSSIEPGSNTFLARKLNSDRQLVWVNVDSLAGLLNDLQKKQSAVFRWEDEGRRIVFKSLDNKPFNTLFLDGEYISRFDSVANANVEKLKSGYGFQLPVEMKPDRRFVRMPAEIMHSIQLQTTTD